MAKLKTLLLRKKIDDTRKALEALRAKDADFEKREADLTEAFGEVTEETTEEERATLEGEMNQFDADKEAHEGEKKDLEEVIRSAEEELEELEKKQDEKPAAEPAPAPEDKPEERKVENTTMRRTIFDKLSAERRSAILNSETVKNWLGEYRSAMKEKRAITNVGLTIPTEILPLLRENIANWSKLYDKVNLQAVGGEARQPIMGTIPEAVWTECCANLNELDLAFNDWTVDCYKVGGYFAICKANVEDSDIDLLAEIVTAIGQAIGKALDKAILFGRNTSTNSKMPLGVASRIAQTAAPADYPTTARAWTDLHVTHVTDIPDTASGADFFKGIVLAAAAAATDYSRGPITWCMNEQTYRMIQAASLSINAAGAIVAGATDTMPVVGGDIVVLNFIPNGVIVYGYFDMYLLAERAGREFAQSEHVRFLQDQIVYKGTARYDGAPVIAEAFGVVTVDGETFNPAAVTFAADAANNA